MIEWLYSLDVAVFHFLNSTLANPLGDVFWPYLTDYDKQWPVRILLIAIWLALLIRGGKRGRTAALLVIPLLIISDQLSSSVIKSLFARVRPCHAISPTELHLLVGCGGFSFPSSHAVNNFGIATMFSYFYPRAKVALFTFASLVAMSRVFVGVHYPSDVLGGAIIGVGVAFFVLWTWNNISERFFPKLAVERSST